MTTHQASLFGDPVANANAKAAARFVDVWLELARREKAPGQRIHVTGVHVSATGAVVVTAMIDGKVRISPSSKDAGEAAAAVWAAVHGSDR